MHAMRAGNSLFRPRADTKASLRTFWRVIEVRGSQVESVGDMGKLGKKREDQEQLRATAHDAALAERDERVAGPGSEALAQRAVGVGALDEKFQAGELTLGELTHGDSFQAGELTNVAADAEDSEAAQESRLTEDEAAVAATKEEHAAVTKKEEAAAAKKKEEEEGAAAKREQAEEATKKKEEAAAARKKEGNDAAAAKEKEGEATPPETEEATTGVRVEEGLDVMDALDS